MSVESLINLIAVIGSSITLYFLMRRPIDRVGSSVDRLEEKSDARFNRMEAKLNGVQQELVELRLETRNC